MGSAKNVLTAVCAIAVWIVGAIAATGSGADTPEALAAQMHDALSTRDQGRLLDAHIEDYGREAVKPGVRSVLRAMPEAAPLGVHHVDEFRVSQPLPTGGVVDFVTFRHAFFYADDAPILVTMTTRRVSGGEWRLVSLETRQINPATYLPPRDLTLGHILAALLAGASVLLSAAALATALLTPRLKRRILWSIAILTLGFPVVAFNWSTAQFSLLFPVIEMHSGSISFLNSWVVLLGASTFKASVVSAWMIHFAPPLGALAFFIQASRGRLARRDAVLSERAEAPSGAPVPALRLQR